MNDETGRPQVSRPAAQLAPPTIVDPAFVDPAATLQVLEHGAPYRTLAAAQKDQKGDQAAPWFRNFWALGGKVLFPDAEEAFRSPLLIEAAKTAFNAEVVVPHAMMTNLNLPSPAGAPHLDLPFFRGAHQREIPSWMLGPMGYSGLFHQWAIPVASAITWFYTGDGGEFEYWEHGFDEPSTSVPAQGTNKAVIADNEYMYHRVRQVGRPDQFLPDNAIPATSKLHLEDDHWVVIDDRTGTDRPPSSSNNVIARYRRNQVRLSILWKAFCFADQVEADAYTNGTDNLTPDLIVEIFQNDLEQRGMRSEHPPNLAIDQKWAETIRSVYTAEQPPATANN